MDDGTEQGEGEGWLRIVSGGGGGGEKPGEGPTGEGEGKRKGEGGELKEDLLYVYAGILPMASRDLLQWPFAAPGEGLIDVVVQPQVSLSSSSRAEGEVASRRQQPKN